MNTSFWGRMARLLGLLILVLSFSVPHMVQAATPTNTPFKLRVNFQPSRSWLPAGYLHDPTRQADIGHAYGLRSDGYTFGWSQDNTANMRDRDVLAPDATVGASSAQEYDTLALMQKRGSVSWEVAVPPGVYHVTMYSDDPSYSDSVYNTLVEGVTVTNRTPGQPVTAEGSASVEVTDGKLTVSNGPDAVNNKINWIEITQLFAVKVNFQPKGSPLVDGYVPDYGHVFTEHASGYSYGWNVDVSQTARDRKTAADGRYDTLMHTQLYGQATWEIAVPEGQYDVRIVAGDPSHSDSVYHFDVEGYFVVVNGAPTKAQRWVEGTAYTVQVFATDGRLTITNGTNASNNKIAFVEIQQTGIGR